MFKKRSEIMTGILILVIALGALWALINHYTHLPERINQMETIVMGQSRYAPGSATSMRVIVRDVSDQKPIAGADVNVSVQPQAGGASVPLYSGVTDDLGVANVAFTLPADIDPAQQLIVESSSALGTDHLEQEIMVERDFKILLTTDKPLYQPGQLIHIRGLALSAFDRRPAAGESVEFIIADGKGNKVFRESVETSEFGVAAVDFQLASEVVTGLFKITAQMGSTSSEKTVTVEHYVLPKFKVSLVPDRPYYRPGETVTGVLTAEYFFGKKVAAGAVSLEGFTFDFERQGWVNLQGETDESGTYAFVFALPDYIVGTDLEGGAGRFYLQASVTDQAQHTEHSSLSMPISQNSLIIEAVPESGQIRAGVENILYVLTSYPDGTPAQTRLEVRHSQGSDTLNTGPYGMASVRLTPESSWLEIEILARDATGNIADQYFYFEGAWEEETVLLRPDRPTYQIGESMQLEVLTSSHSGNVYLDIVREGQILSTRTVEIDAGHGLVIVDLSSDMFGTLEMHAYKILTSGHIVRDTRLVVVDAPTDLNLTITSDQQEYLPGENAVLDFLVRGQDGIGAQAALGLAIVDESVFALAEQDPGFAKLYFLLEAELLQPKYDIHGFSIPELIKTSIDDPELQTALEGAAQASLADAAAFVGGLGLNLNSHDEKIRIAEERQTAFFTGVTKGTLGVSLTLPIIVTVLMVMSLRREGVLARSIVIMLGVVITLVLVFLITPVPEWYGESALDRLSYFLDQIMYGAEDTGLALLLLGVVSFLALSIHAWRSRNRALGISLALTFAFIPLFAFLIFSASRSDLNPDESVLVWVILVLALVPLAFLLRAAGFGAKGKIGWAFASLFVATFALTGSLVLPVFTLSSGMQELRGGVVVGLADFEGAPLPEAAPAEDALERAATSTRPSAGEPPRLRQFFPETMFWQPEAITDANGNLILEVPLADSITTWRLTALASAQDGRLGAATAGIRVFQDFFVDLDLPRALTQNDEISVPVGVFNYLPDAQSVQLEIASADWFELLDDPVKEMTIGANDIDVVYFRIKAKQFGRRALKITARGTSMSDAIQKEVTVFPDGRSFTFTSSDRLSIDEVIEKVMIPPSAINGTQRLSVKIYPGILSQVVEGLDSILRMPFGCFEQTSSTTYPNVLVLDYLQTTGQVSPETQFKAEEYINLGYQRLTTFEVTGGGFSLFGGPPADRMLTAYGLQEFTDMSRVHNVDPDIISRAAEWLLSQQESDGSWKNDQGLVHENTWTNLQNERLPVTAYIVWSLIDADFANDSRTQSGLAYVREHLSQADDPYVVALVANALVSADLAEGKMSSFTQSTLEKLAQMAQFDGQTAYWTSKVATFMGSEGLTGSIETTALAAFALLRAEASPDIANAALTYLVREKDSFGTWYNTQATVLSLKAMLQSVRAGAENVNATVTISLNEGQTQEVNVSPDNFDIVQTITFDDVSPGVDNRISIRMAGEGNLMYQIRGSYYLPWAEVAELQKEGPPEMFSIDVDYDRTELTVNDTVQVDIAVSLNEPGLIEWALIDLGIPPGFSIVTDDLNALVSRFDDVPEDYAYPTIERYELTGRQVLIYIGNLAHEYPLTFSYRMQAKFPLNAKAPASNAYDYYNPDVRGEAVPIELVVSP
jgi:uncharacterized protein YfaS (alpha-2-macroglobulin family)